MMQKLWQCWYFKYNKNLPLPERTPSLYTLYHTTLRNNLHLSKSASYQTISDKFDNKYDKRRSHFSLMVRSCVNDQYSQRRGKILLTSLNLNFLSPTSSTPATFRTSFITVITTVRTINTSLKYLYFHDCINSCGLCLSFSLIFLFGFLFGISNQLFYSSWKALYSLQINKILLDHRK